MKHKITTNEKHTKTELQNNSQIGGPNNSRELPQQQLSLKSIYQLLNMYVVEYDDGSGNTIKMHFNEEQYKRIFALFFGNYPYEYKEGQGVVKFKSVLGDVEGDEEDIADFNILIKQFFFENEYLKAEHAYHYFNYATNKNYTTLSSDKREPKNPLFYYSTKETPSTKQQKQDGDIPEKIEVNFNIAYGEGKAKPKPEEFNKNILSCYIKIQSGTYKGKYIKFTPVMDDKDVITIKRDDKLYSCEGKDMKEIVSVDYFTKLVEGDLPKLEFKINNQVIKTNDSQQVVGDIEPIFSSSPKFDEIKTNTTFKHQPSPLSVGNPAVGGGERRTPELNNKA